MPADLLVAAPDPAAEIPWHEHDLVCLRNDTDPTPYFMDERGYHHALDCRGCRLAALLAERQQASVLHREEQRRAADRLREALAERQQDKERIERLCEIGKAAQIVADLNGERRSSYGRVVTRAEYANAMFNLETAVVCNRAALAVEEDAGD